jgi:hypothetical protein
MQKLIYLLLFISVNASAQCTYYGNNWNKFVHAQINDSIAIVEICDTDFKNKRYTHFDTLRYNNKKLIGEKSKIIFKKGQYIYKPGKFVLYKDSFNDQLLKTRIDGYKHHIRGELSNQLDWITMNNLNTDVISVDFDSTKSIDPPFYYKQYDVQAQKLKDSIQSYNCYGYNKLIITNNKLIGKKQFLVTTDTTLIKNVWNTLIENKMIQNKMENLFIYHFLAFYVASAFVSPWLLFLTPVAYGAAYASTESEKFVANRFVSGKTYILHFYKDEKRVLEVEIYKNHIITQYYKFRLVKDFSQFIK